MYLVLSQQNGYLTSIRQTCSSGDLVWTLAYDDVTDHLFTGQRPLNAVAYPTGLKETLVYEGLLMRFRTDKGEGALPAVVRGIRSPGAGQPDIIRTYSYSATNFMGYEAAIQHFDPDHDNLYDVLSPYDYWSKETLVGASPGAIPAVSTERHYNNYHLLVSEKETVAGTTFSTMRTTTYYAEPGRQFIDQPVTFQSPKQQTVTWSDGTASRQETTALEYDAFGNLAKKTAPDGTVTALIYYPAGGEGQDCPPEPSGFTRFLKQKTVTPAPGDYAVPVSQTRWRYQAFPVHTASTLPGAVVQSAMEHGTVTRPLITRDYGYLNDPASYDHGRMLSMTNNVLGDDGTIYPVVESFGADTTQSGRVSQTVTKLRGTDHADRRGHRDADDWDG